MSKPLLCKLGLHDWGTKYNKIEVPKSREFYDKTIRECRRCAAIKEGKRRSDWDLSKGKY